MWIFRLSIFFILSVVSVNCQTTETIYDTQTGSTASPQNLNPGNVEDVHEEMDVPDDVGHGVKVTQSEITYSSHDFRLEGHVVLTVRAHLVTQCSRRCDLHPLCVSFNFYSGDERCELNSEADTDVALTAFPGATYIRQGTYTIDGAALGICADNPCENGGWCMNVTTTEGTTKALCICKDGWIGLTCSQAEGTLGWGDWSDWSECSATCGEAWQSRTRQCLNLNTGKRLSPLYCLGPETDVEPCNMPNCPEWKPWSAWSECSTSHTCGEGEMMRTRECTNGGTPGKDRLCKGETNQTQKCFKPHCDQPLKQTFYGEGEVRMYDIASATFRVLCGDGWGTKDADVACKQLGFHKGALEAIQSTDLNPNEWYILSNFECDGSETSLQACKHSQWENITCVSKTAAAAKCVVDGGWSAWTEWDACSVTCAEGKQRRTRQCNYPPPTNGGDDCQGEAEQSKDCLQPSCPADGSRWKEWSEWSMCSETCNGGDRTRTRTCVSGACPGPTLETERCNVVSCHVAGKWTLWAYWSPCDVTCDGGLRKRDRDCLKLEDDDITCTGHGMEIETCANNECQGSPWRPWEGWSDCSASCGGGERSRSRAPMSCNDVTTCNDVIDTQIVSCQPDPCPVDGEWLPWTEWTQCNKTCDGGWRWRNRECLPAKHGGEECPGKPQEIEACNTENCPEDAYWESWTEWSSCDVSCGGGRALRARVCVPAKFGGEDCLGDAEENMECNTENCPENAYWKEWVQWSQCNISCGGGTRYRSRECVPAKFGGEECEGPPEEREDCNTHHCPVDCVWNEWTDWEQCNVSCSDGFKRRTRMKEEEQYGGLACEGSDNEWESCNLRPCPVDGSWEPWAEWSTCTKSCGTGSMTRLRTCFKLHGGSDCEGTDNESSDCNEHPCPVDGVWNVWSEWTACSVTCADGIRTRDRTCEGPFHGGANCTGDTMEEEGCFPKHCPVDGVWEEWSEWTLCNQVCGGGTQDRERVCIGPFHDGKECPGDAAETQACNSHDCPEDGYWELWSQWGSCSKSCGAGSQTRSRVCIPPKHGGTDCDGESEEEQECNTHHCPVAGEWEGWTEWASCNVSCGGGSQQRSRLCHEPQHGGADCEGDSMEQQSCNHNPCPVDGYWLEWGEWEECSVTCGGGDQGRQRVCQPPQHGGLDCHGDTGERQSCGTNPCPVDGFWHEWGEWEPCNVTCGGGQQFRIRQCEAPLHGGKDCDGNAEDRRECNTHHCPVDCVWHEWSEWEHCNVTCAWGQQRRQRGKDDEQYGGDACTGNDVDWQDCFPRHCPVDGVWQPWSDWTTCTVTCGGGTSVRNRTCDPPKYDGKDCEGALSESRICSTNPCPIPGDWTTWTSWSPCTVSCAGGTRTRSRDCDMESYGDLTAPCIGNTSDIGECHQYPCTPLATTCQEWVSLGLVDTVDADVKPNPSMPAFRIHCEVDFSQKTGTGTIDHDKKGRHQVEGFEGAGEFVADFTYLDAEGQPLPLESVITYTDLSSSCSQYISWECNAAGIHHPIQPDIQTTFWTNRYNQIRKYWGGAEPGTNMCACGMNRNCTDVTKLCNCDMNDNQWRRDDGYITHREDLPIYGFRAGDTGTEGTMRL